MRVEKSVTAVTWIPSEAIDGLPKLPFELGITSYDDPPPARLAPGDLEGLRDRNGFREANELAARATVVNVAPPVSASTFVIAAVSDVLPWST